MHLMKFGHTGVMHITLSLGSIIASDAIIKAFIPAEVTIILEGDICFLCKAEVYLDIVLTSSGMPWLAL